jgi:hypothetical protein
MSGHTCRETYCSYGSYLRSRGYDAAICNLFTDIEAGKVSLGPIVPNGECGVTISGDVSIQSCPNTSDPASSGILNLYGGSFGTVNEPLNTPTDLSLQANRGAHIYGPIVQTRGGNISKNTTHNGGAVNILTNDTYFTGEIIGDLTGSSTTTYGFKQINKIGSGTPTGSVLGELGEVKIAKEKGPGSTEEWYLYILVERDVNDLANPNKWKKVRLHDL